MIFLEKKTQDGYEYKVEDLFGIIDLYSEVQLPANTLDACVLSLLNHSGTEGEIKAKEGMVKFKFTRNNEWSEDDNQ
jgi:hypothetical protein